MKSLNKFQQSLSLKEKNLLKINSVARFFIEISDLDDLNSIQDFVTEKKISFCTLGEGSNVVLPNLIDKLVISISYDEIIVEENFVFANL